MNKFKGIMRDLLLVSVSALIAVLVVQFTGQKQTGPQHHTEGTVTDVEDTTPGTGDSVNEQLIALRIEMAKTHVALNKRIGELAYSVQEPLDDSNSVESLLEQFANPPSLEDQAALLAEAEDYDEEASEQFEDRIITRLSQLTLDSSRLNGVDCFASKCAMEFEHDSAIDEGIFVDNILFESKGLFNGRFSYSSEPGEDGKVYTKVISDR